MSVFANTLNLNHNLNMWPKISILIPTLNAASVLDSCLKSISSQDYPKEQIEIIVADGGSTDATLEIASKYGAKIVENKLKTGEAGKKSALDSSTGDFCALIDSDNVLPNALWLKNMIKPLLQEQDAVGSEPWEYTLRATDGFITRYCALLGMNDPLAHFLGNYDRLNGITGKWTGLELDQMHNSSYIIVTLDKNKPLPTIGANGTIFRAAFLKKHASGDYLFDIDILASGLKSQNTLKFIKVKEGIVHSYCESDISKFAKKQRRRVYDFLYHKRNSSRSYSWAGNSAAYYFGYAKFILACLTIFPLLWQTMVGYIKKRDTAWLFHPLACEITLWEYGWGVINSLFKSKELDRSKWKQ